MGMAGTSGLYLSGLFPGVKAVRDEDEETPFPDSAYDAAYKADDDAPDNVKWMQDKVLGPVGGAPSVPEPDVAGAPDVEAPIPDRLERLRTKLPQARAQISRVSTDDGPTLDDRDYDAEYAAGENYVWKPGEGLSTVAEQERALRKQRGTPESRMAEYMRQHPEDFEPGSADAILTNKIASPPNRDPFRPPKMSPAPTPPLSWAPDAFRLREGPDFGAKSAGVSAPLPKLPAQRGIDEQGADIPDANASLPPPTRDPQIAAADAPPPPGSAGDGVDTPAPPLTRERIAAARQDYRPPGYAPAVARLGEGLLAAFGHRDPNREASNYLLGQENAWRTEPARMDAAAKAQRLADLDRRLKEQQVATGRSTEIKNLREPAAKPLTDLDVARADEARARAESLRREKPASVSNEISFEEYQKLPPEGRALYDQMHGHGQKGAAGLNEYQRQSLALRRQDLDARAKEREANRVAGDVSKLGASMQKPGVADTYQGLIEFDRAYPGVLQGSDLGKEGLSFLDRLEASWTPTRGLLPEDKQRLLRMGENFADLLKRARSGAATGSNEDKTYARLQGLDVSSNPQIMSEALREFARTFQTALRTKEHSVRPAAVQRFRGDGSVPSSEAPVFQGLGASEGAPATLKAAAKAAPIGSAFSFAGKSYMKVSDTEIEEE